MNYAMQGGTVLIAASAPNIWYLSALGEGSGWNLRNCPAAPAVLPAASGNLESGESESLEPKQSKIKILGMPIRHAQNVGRVRTKTPDPSGLSLMILFSVGCTQYSAWRFVCICYTAIHPWWPNHYSWRVVQTGQFDSRRESSRCPPCSQTQQDG